MTFLLAWPLFAADPPSLNTDAERRSYAFGMANGLTLQSQSAGLDPELILRGLSDVLKNQPTRLTVQEATALTAATTAGALLQARARAQSISCGNNLKQAGLAFKMWALDHDDKFSFNVSTKSGGSEELCARDANGYEKNPAPHFQVLSNELITPRLLVCPADESRKPARDWDQLSSTNITYRLQTGTKLNDSLHDEILILCPIHQHKLNCDGSVKNGPPPPPTPAPPVPPRPKPPEA
jgi:hypothetical protein